MAGGLNTVITKKRNGIPYVGVMSDRAFANIGRVALEISRIAMDWSGSFAASASRLSAMRFNARRQPSIGRARGKHGYGIRRIRIGVIFTIRSFGAQAEHVDGRGRPGHGVLFNRSRTVAKFSATKT
jgi:hypothetical protein